MLVYACLYMCSCPGVGVCSWESDQGLVCSGNYLTLNCIPSPIILLRLTTFDNDFTQVLLCQTQALTSRVLSWLSIPGLVMLNWLSWLKWHLLESPLECCLFPQDTYSFVGSYFETKYFSVTFYPVVKSFSVSKH